MTIAIQVSRAPREPASPYLPAPDAPHIDIEADEQDGFLYDQLRNVDGVVDRLLDPARSQVTLLGCLGLLVVGAVAFGYVTASVLHVRYPFAHAVERAICLIVAHAAALGPIYATGILVHARLPMARLVVTLLSASATAATLLAGMTPVLHVAWGLDRDWAGPLLTAGTVMLAGIAGGLRLRALLLRLAERLIAQRSAGEGGALSKAERSRVAIFARMAMVFLTFTVSLSMWTALPVDWPR